MSCSIIARCLDHIRLQIYMDVDCSDITYDTPPSPTILQAVEKATQRLNATEGLIISLPLFSDILALVVNISSKS